MLKPVVGDADGSVVERCGHGRRDDRGDIVLGWLTRLTVVLAILGVIGFDLVSVGAGHLAAEDQAQDAARAAVTSFRADQDVQRAYEAALADTLEDGKVGDSIDPATFSVAEDGSVTLTLQHVSPTLLVEKIAPLRRFATATATVTGRPAR